MAVVKEVDLKDFITESEHDGMFGLKPLLYINELIVFLVTGLCDVEFGNFVVEVNNELFQEHEFLLEVLIIRQGVVLLRYIWEDFDILVLARWILYVCNCSKLIN